MSDLRLSIPDELVELLAERVADRLGSPATVAEPEPWVGVDDAARHLAASRQRIYDLVKGSGIPHRKEGRRLLFRLSELDAWLAPT